MSLEDVLLQSAYTSPNSGAYSLTSGLSATAPAVVSNKELVDNSVIYVDDGDNTKKVAFEVSGVTSGVTRQLVVPNSDGTIALVTDIPTDYVDLTSTQTITGEKKMSNLVIDDAIKFNNPSDTFQYTLSGGNITANRNIEFGILAQDDTLLYQNQAQSNIGGPKTFINQALRLQDNTGTRNITLTTSAQTVNVNATFPTLTASDTFVFANESQTVTNKTLDNTNSVQIESLTKTGEQDGDIIIRTGGSWTYLPAGSEDAQLQINGGLPVWVSPSYVVYTAFGAGASKLIPNTPFTQLDLFLPTSGITGSTDWEKTAVGGEIKYTGARTRNFYINLEMGVQSDVPNNELQLRIFKNGIIIPTFTHICGTDANGKKESATMTQIWDVAQNDILSVWAVDSSGSSNIIISGYTWSIHSLN